jgi:hypothetical protein
MDASVSGKNGDDPAGLYSGQLRVLEAAQAAEQTREKQLGYAKIGVALFTIVAAVILLRFAAYLEFLLLPVALFVVLAVWHENRLQSIRLRKRAILFYERGLARIENRWEGTGETGERFLDPLHPYARDLDIFGRASLFELLCTARTRAGEATLAAWLLTAAPVATVVARQGAVRELKDQTKFRETLFCQGETVRAGVHPERLTEWGECGQIFKGRTIQVVTSALGLLWIGSMICWGVWGMVGVALAVSALNLAWAHRIHARLEEASDAIEVTAKDMEILAGVLALIDHGKFDSSILVEIQSRLKHDAIVPSDAVRRLARIVNYLESRRNPAMRLLDVVTFWSAHFAFAAERWQREFGPSIRGWLAAVGEFEALTALAGYAFEHGEDVFPDFAMPGPVFDAKELAHPLLPVAKAVRNDLRLGDGLQLIVLSGPNMAGKSTFIRCVGVNAVLAQCGAPVRAKSLKLSPLAVAASICILDSLSGGVSRFYAEIHKLKLATDLAQGPVPVLFLLDELLSGTNSHDRLEGTKLVVQSLTDRGAIGIVSTHDLALAEIPASMGGHAANCHFEDRLEAGGLVFDYKLKAGTVKTSNALELMRSIGLGRDK